MAYAEPDQTGGYNFYDDNGQPITWQQFVENNPLPIDFNAETGKRYAEVSNSSGYMNDLRSRHSNLDDTTFGYMYQLMQTGMDEGAAAHEAMNSQEQIAQDTTLTPPPTTKATTPATTGGGTGKPAFVPVTYDDGTGPRIYSTAEDLAQAVDRRVNKDYNESVKKIDQNFKNGFITIDERDDEIKKTRKALVEKRTTDLQSVSGYFNSISPDAIQSGQGVMEGKAVEDYTTQNKQLGSELSPGLYDTTGRIRQDVSMSELQPYMTELSDTGALARGIASNFQNRDTNLTAASENLRNKKTQIANDYIGNKPDMKASDYTNYLNSGILSPQSMNKQGAGFSSVDKKVDRYGNPIDEYVYKGM